MTRVLKGCFKEGAHGHENFAKEPAMTRAETLEAIAAGIEIVRGVRQTAVELLQPVRWV